VTAEGVEPTNDAAQRATAGGLVAHGLPRRGQRGRQRLRGDDPDRGRDLSAAEDASPHRSHQQRRRLAQRATGCGAAHYPVNGYAI